MFRNSKLTAILVLLFSLATFSASAHIVSGDAAHNFSWEHLLAILMIPVSLGAGAFVLYVNSRAKKQRLARKTQRFEDE